MGGTSAPKGLKNSAQVLNHQKRGRRPVLVCNSRHRCQLIDGETLGDRGPQLVSPDLLRRARTDEKSRTAPRTGIKTKVVFYLGNGRNFVPAILITIILATIPIAVVRPGVCHRRDYQASRTISGRDYEQRRYSYELHCEGDTPANRAE